MMPPRKTIVNNEEFDVLDASFTKYDSNNEETIDVGTTVNNDEDDWLATAFLEDDDHSNAKKYSQNEQRFSPKAEQCFQHERKYSQSRSKSQRCPRATSFNIDWEVFDALIERERILGPLASNHPQMTIQAMSDQMDPSGRPILTLPQRGDIALSVVHQMVQPVELGIGTHNPDYGSARSSNHYLQASVQVTSDVSGRAILPLPQRQPSVANQKTAPVGQRQNVGLHAVKKRSKSETSSDTVATSVQDASDLPGSSRYPLINSQPGRYPPPPQPRLWPAPQNSVPPPSRMSFRMLSASSEL
ncbi:hypothetical protein C8J56DRAFT_204063 [Mycena floridula]|nr:hypothetical protein C8J56DRAFT_204063 [Mycena floridula]